MTFVVGAKNDPKKRVVMLLVVKKTHFLKIFLSITFFNMGHLNNIVKNAFFGGKIIAFFDGKKWFFWTKYFFAW